MVFGRTRTMMVTMFSEIDQSVIEYVHYDVVRCAGVSGGGRKLSVSPRILQVAW